MGAWGSGILQDDGVADVVDFVRDHIKKGNSLDNAVSCARKEFAELEADPDEGPLVWLALAHLQWKYGVVEADILDRVRRDVAAENGLERWRDDPKLFAKRKLALTSFLAKLESQNPKPSALPKLVLRKAPFCRGDCLAISLPENRFTAALVLDEDNSNPEFGKNLVASLDYYQSTPPNLEVFEIRNWLIRTWGVHKHDIELLWYLPVRFKEARKRIVVVGNIPIKQTDPKGAGMYTGHTGWNNLGNGIIYRAAHRAKDA